MTRVALVIAWAVAACGGAVDVAGHPAPDFMAERVLGDASPHLSDLKGHVVMVEFWSIRCGVCRYWMTRFADVAAQHPNTLLLLISRDEIPDEMRTLAPPAGVTFLRSADGDAAHHFGVSDIPVLFVIDKQGIVRFVDVPVIHLDEVERQVASLAQ